MSYERPTRRGSRGLLIVAVGIIALFASGTNIGAQSPKGLPGSSAVTGPTVAIDNGIAGDGRVQVASGRGGETVDVEIDPVGAAPLQNIMFELNHYMDVGADGAPIELSATTISQEPTPSGPNTLTSAGSFAGLNGTISWTAVSSIAPGSTTYQTAVTFTSGSPFGVARFIQYADIDVPPLGTNNLVVFGTFGVPGFELLTVQAATTGNAGLRQLNPVVSGATCPGWAARPFAALRSAITGAGATYSPAGDITGLGSTTDARFPGAPAFGPADITAAIACDLNPAATLAAITYAVSAESNVLVPTLSEWASILLAGMLTLLAVWSLRRKAVRVA